MARFVRCSLAFCSFAALAGLLMMVTGCAPRSTVMLEYPHAPRATLTQSPHEHYQSVSNVTARDRRALIEDLDMLFLTDRPTRLTRWHDH